MASLKPPKCPNCGHKCDPPSEDMRKNVPMKEFFCCSNCPTYVNVQGEDIDDFVGECYRQNFQAKSFAENGPIRKRCGVCGKSDKMQYSDYGYHCNRCDTTVPSPWACPKCHRDNAIVRSGDWLRCTRCDVEFKTNSAEGSATPEEKNRYYCPECKQKRGVFLIAKDRPDWRGATEPPWEKTYACPRCHGSFTVKEATARRCSIRVAQFGGTNGSVSPHSPGTNPFGKGGSSSGTSAFSDRAIDEGLDAIMARTRKNFLDDPERNIETRLEMLHDYKEKDTIPTHLSLEERARLRVRRQIHRQELYNQQCADSIKRNSPAYIKEHFQPKDEQMHTWEEQLSARHRNKPDEKNPREDESPPQDRPTRRHTVLADTMSHMPGRMHGDDDQDAEWSGDRLNLEQQRLHSIPMGNTPQAPLSNADLEDYFQDSAMQDWGGKAYGPNTTTLIGNYPGADEIGGHSAAPTLEHPSPFSPKDSNAADASDPYAATEANNPNVSTEGQLSSLNAAPPSMTPKIPRSSDEHHEDEVEGRWWKEPQSINDVYNDKNYSQYGNIQMPRLASHPRIDRDLLKHIPKEIPDDDSWFNVNEFGDRAEYEALLDEFMEGVDE